MPIRNQTFGDEEKPKSNFIFHPKWIRFYIGIEGKVFFPKIIEIDIVNGWNARTLNSMISSESHFYKKKDSLLVETIGLKINELDIMK